MCVYIDGGVAAAKWPQDTAERMNVKLKRAFAKDASIWLLITSEVHKHMVKFSVSVPDNDQDHYMCIHFVYLYVRYAL